MAGDDPGIALAPVLLAGAGALFLLAFGLALAPTSRLGRRGLSFGLSALGCVLLLGLGALVLATGQVVTATAGSVLGLSLVDVRLDALGAFFLVVLGGVGAASSVYGIGYAAPTRSGRDRTGAAYPIFLCSLALVFGANSAFALLFAWELMALSSAALVAGSRPSAATARFAYIYLAMTHLATAALIAGLAILAGAGGSAGFDGLRAGAAGLSPLARDVVFVLVLVGFGTKAGMIPLHVWLPRAHPVAPSHVSAVMSGVMVKAGIYGIVRFGIDILGPGPESWGLIVLVLGAVSAVLGVLYALMEHDLKRLLAFSSIENVGIILMSLGVALMAGGAGLPSLATLALAAALFHSLNHAAFKTTLFLAAGSVQAGAGTRDLNTLGGLARLMPATTVAFVIGAVAISGVPPLNGFASEWLTFQGLLQAGAEASLSAVARSAALLAVGALGLTSALAVACFVTATGIGFLALPRSPGAAKARERSRWMGAAMVVLAGACVAIGVAAGPVAGGVARVSAAAIGGLPEPATLPTAASLAVGPGLGGALYGAAVVGGVLLLLTAGLWLVAIRRQPVRRVPTWTCGVRPEPAFQYTATSYAKLIRLYFRGVLHPVREVSVELHPGTPFPRTVRYRGKARHLIDERLYGPAHRAAVEAADLVRRLQGGSLQLYLAYTVAALVVLLAVAR